jgi:hypothetical protein
MHGTYIKTIKQVYLCSAAYETPTILILKINILAEALSSMQMIRKQEMLRVKHLPESYDYRIYMKI